MSVEYKTHELSVLPQGSQKYASRLMAYSQWEKREKALLTQADSRPAQYYFDKYYADQIQEQHNLANDFFEHAAEVNQQLDEMIDPDERRQATSLFMLHILYADHYGRFIANKKIPNIQFSIRKDTNGDHLSEQAANLVTLTFTNPDSSPDNPETISFNARWFSLLEINDNKLSRPLNAAQFSRLLGQVKTIILPETTEKDTQEGLYRRALEITQINRIIESPALTPEDQKRLRKRKIALIDDLLAARIAQLEAIQNQQEARAASLPVEQKIRQTIHLNLLRSTKTANGRRLEQYDLIELEVDHPRIPNRVTKARFVNLTDPYYSIEERALLQPKIIQYDFDSEGFRNK